MMPWHGRHSTRPAPADQTVRALALFGALTALFGEFHPFCDQFLQSSDDAKQKGEPGRDGARACVRHVRSYTLAQTAAAVAMTRAFGYRLPVGAQLALVGITGATHYLIDRRTPLITFLRWHRVGKAGYLDHATVQRRPGVVDTAGPGTALMELDQAAHRAIGVGTAVAATWLAIRTENRRKAARG